MRVILLTGCLLLLGGTALGASNELTMGASLTLDAYCSVKNLISGNIGLLLGFGVALLGLFKLIQGGGMGSIVLIIAGACVTALPGLIEGALGGLASVMRESKIGKADGPTHISCNNK